MKLQISLSSSDETQIARGINVLVTIKDVKIAHGVLDGTLSAEQVLKFIKGGTGIWWYILGRDGASIRDAQDFAKKEDDLTESFGQYLLSDMESGRSKDIYVEMPIVLVAKRPRGWEPDDNPSEGYGLDGNSYIDTDRWKTVELISVQYYSRNGWVTKPVHGKRIKL